MGCPSFVTIGDNLVFSVCTHDPDTGVLTDADAVPAYRVYEDETDPPILTGNMAKLDDDDTTGFYTESIACTTANGFEDGKSYTIYIVATVDSDQGGICYGFKAVDHSDIVTAMQASGTDLDYIIKALVNKAIWTHANGNLEMFSDAGVSLGSIAAQVSTDGTYTTRKRTVI